MENQLPIPTDNIFKFYAMFGLLLFVFSAGSLIYVIHSANELAFQATIEIATIKQSPNASPLDQAKMQVLEKRLEITNSDKNLYIHALGVFAGVSLSLMAYGFTVWHKNIQPIQDELARLQLEKLRHEIKQLKHRAKEGDPVRS